MKKTAVILVLLVMSFGASAQLLNHSISGRPYVKGGISLVSFSALNADDYKNNIGYNVAIGYQMSLFSSNLFYFNYSPEIGFNTKGWKKEDSYDDYDDWYDIRYYYDNKEKFLSHRVQITPINLEFGLNITNSVSINVHGGFFGAFDYYGKCTTESIVRTDSRIIDKEKNEELISEIPYFRYYDIGVLFGCAMWIKDFTIDFTMQKGFTNIINDPETFAKTSNNINIGIGYRF